MNLREGVTFHDGSPLTSADVVASLERILDEATGAVVRSNLLSIESITAPDDLTVVMTLSAPDATLPAALSDLNTAIVPAAAIEAGTVANEPNGTGPFTFGDVGAGPAARARPRSPTTGATARSSTA